MYFNKFVKFRSQLLSQLQLYTFPFMYFMPLAWRWPFEIETCCHLEDKTDTSYFDGTLFLLL